MAKKRIAILFGGISPEHDVSCMSAVYLLHYLPEQYESVLIGITRKGRMLFYPGDADGIADGSWEQHPDCCSCLFSTDSSKQGIYKILSDQTVSFLGIDCVFPVLYGKDGEDGSMQGVLEQSGIPFVGSGSRCSALCTDREFCSMVLGAAGIKTSGWITVRRGKNSISEIISEVQARFGYPVYVKPANSSSMSGVFHASDSDELERAVRLALVRDDKVLVRDEIPGVHVRCGVIGNEEPRASVLGEIGFLPEPPSGKWEKNTQTLLIPARISQDLCYRIREIAVRIFRLMECAGMADIDFYVTTSEDIFVNQIHTVPGFSEISIFPRLWQAVDIGPEELLEKLIQLAFSRAEVDY